MRAPARKTIKRVIDSIDEALPYDEFMEECKRRVMDPSIPVEIEVEGTRYRGIDCWIVPELTGTMLYTIGIYEEIEEK